MKRILVGAMVLCALAGTASGDAKQAKKLNTKGMKLYKKKKFDEAQKVFVEAVAADPDMVIPHYNLASTAAINGDVDAVLEQLAWLKASSDPAAAKRLVKAKTDKDFRNVAGHAQVREALGLAALDPMTADAVLEYGGVWNGVDMGMMAAWEELSLAKNGTVKIRSYTGEDAVLRKSKAKWSIVDGKLHVEYKGGNAVDYAWGECGSMMGDETDGSMCLLSDTVELWRGPHTD